MSDKKDILIKQLCYRATRRGTKENDLIFTNFFSKYVNQLTYNELLDLSAILNCDDNDIFSWISNKQSLPKGINSYLIDLLIKANLK